MVTAENVGIKRWY